MHHKKSELNIDKKLVYIILAMILVILALLVLKSYFLRALPKTGPSATPTPSTIADVIYDCDDKKSIHAVFQPNQVILQLSDGRSMTVPQAVSASGARYANSDESFVFWNKGETAFIQEGQATTFSDCNQKASDLQPTKGDITIKGELVCLPHKNTTGPQTMECAYGLKAAGGEYYGLFDKDPQYKNISNTPMNTQVEVTGAIKLNTDNKYNTIGTIYVTSIK
jgi:membrane-bound inhibitor of C-type lysozyme